MPLEQSLDEEINATQLKIQELAKGMEKLDRDYHCLLKELDFTEEQLKAYVENSSNFSPPLWEQLQKEKQQLEENVNVLLANVSDPAKTKKSRSEQSSIQQHWIFVR